jgi:DNA-directed RNA polymerase specialized sigma24 family protein
MRKTYTLTETHQYYLLGKIDRKHFEGLVFQYLLNNYERFRVFEGNRDRFVDFLAWLYPRLSRAIDYYREKGSNFEAYIGSIVRWASKEYKSKEADHRATEYVCWKARAEEMMACEAEPDYGDACGLPAFKKGYTPQQILVLLLKSYFFVSEDLLDKIAAYINRSKEELRYLVDEMHRKRRDREQEILDLRNRLHCQYYRCLSFHRRYSSVVPGTAYWEKMRGCYDRAKRRYLSMKKRFTRARLDASNRDVAEVLNIPKGTVDSTLFAIRKKSQS